MHPLHRLGYQTITAAALGTAALGAVLPVLPTTPFLLIAAWSAARHSPQLEARLLAHPRFGRHLLAWREERAISRRAKRAALMALALSLLVTLVVVDFWQVQIAVAGIVTAVAVYLATRPEPRLRRGADDPCA
jgi:uncharacterized protein